MYSTYYLKSDNKQAFFDACRYAGLVNDDGEIITSSSNHCLVLIGDIYRETGEILIDSEGNEYPETEKVDGYHANLRCKEPIGLEHLAVDVKTPRIKFAE